MSWYYGGSAALLPRPTSLADLAAAAEEAAAPAATAEAAGTASAAPAPPPLLLLPSPAPPPLSPTAAAAAAPALARKDSGPCTTPCPKGRAGGVGASGPTTTTTSSSTSGASTGTTALGSTSSDGSSGSNGSSGGGGSGNAGTCDTAVSCSSSRSSSRRDCVPAAAAPARAAAPAGPAASPSAAAGAGQHHQQQQQHAAGYEPDPLLVVVRHQAVLRDARVACRLIATSRAVRDALRAAAIAAVAAAPNDFALGADGDDGDSDEGFFGDAVGGGALGSCDAGASTDGGGGGGAAHSGHCSGGGHGGGGSGHGSSGSSGGGGLCVRFSSYSPERVAAFAAWLARWGGLLRSLSIELSLCGADWHEAESSIANALARARGAAPAGCLALRRFAATPASAAAAALDYLPEWALTSLELGPRAAYSSCFALERLKRLRRLALHGDSGDMLLRSVGALTGLERLALDDLSHASSLAKLGAALPPGLRALRVSVARLRRGEALPPLLLAGRLTALTSLCSAGHPLLVQEGDALPPTLRELRVRDVLSAKPLLPLTALTALEMSRSTTDAAALAALAVALPGLRDVRLTYGDAAAAAGAAAGWPPMARALRSLDVHAVDGTVPAGALRALRQLVGVRHLGVHGGGLARACSAPGHLQLTAAEFAAALRAMTGLTSLLLRGFDLLPPASADEEEEEQEQQEQQQQLEQEEQPPTPPQAAEEERADDTQHADDNAGGSVHGGNACGGGACGGKVSSGPMAAAAAAAAAASSCGDNGGDNGGGAALLLDAIASLPSLQELAFCGVGGVGPVDAGAAAALAAGAAARLTSLSLVDAGLDDAALESLAALPRLRRLRADCNAALTTAALSSPAALEQVGKELRELSVVRCPGIRRGAEDFRARLVACRPHLVVKSSAR